MPSGDGSGRPRAKPASQVPLGKALGGAKSGRCWSGSTVDPRRFAEDSTLSTMELPLLP
jgi:hypothetical protein